ncbi:macro domain-containing protein [Dactylosporangium sp. NPDC049140]|uniref:macro domain-containing protein n=1 Tax=Dactylosporangium sp. NPDC049140 TaxID=3155647 RepID=UPI0033FEF4F0
MQDRDVAATPSSSTDAPPLTPLRRRWQAIKRRTGTVDREAIQWLFATCGVIASALGVAQFVWPDASAAVGGWWLLGTLAFGIIGGLVLRVTKRSIRAKSNTGAWTIQVVPGNVLDHRPCVITTDRRRTLSPEKVAPSSLIVQYLESLDIAGRAEAELAIEQMQSGPLSRPGDVKFIESSGAPGPILLLACGRPTRNGTVTTWSHLTQTYDGLWAAIRSRHFDEVSVPVIGAGYSLVSLSHSAVLLALLLSFHAASTERPVCRLLRVVLPPTDADQEELVLARRFLSALGYSLA